MPRACRRATVRQSIAAGMPLIYPEYNLKSFNEWVPTYNRAELEGDGIDDTDGDVGLLFNGWRPTVQQWSVVHTSLLRYMRTAGLGDMPGWTPADRAAFADCRTAEQAGKYETILGPKLAPPTHQTTPPLVLHHPRPPLTIMALHVQSTSAMYGCTTAGSSTTRTRCTQRPTLASAAGSRATYRSVRMAFLVLCGKQL